MDLITRVIVRDSQGEVIADALVDSIECKDGLMTIATREPKTAAEIHSIARSGGYPEFTNTKISIDQLPDRHLKM